MRKIKNIFCYSLLALLFLFSTMPIQSFANNNVVNVYAWSGEITSKVIHQFEKETGITVNFATYENNEIMYAKMRAVKNPGYDVIMPSSYFVARMVKQNQNMLEKLDRNKLSNFKNIDTQFINPTYDPNLQYSVPYLWGITGIFINQQFYAPESVTSWNDLWAPRFHNQLMLLDDTRENFSMALLALGYSPNDDNPKHIEQAYLKLKALMPNTKVFSSDTIVSIIIDEDATVGSAWNGDAFKAQSENPNINFIFPKEGFVIWVDNFSIPKNAPHKENAYTFINFMLRADVARDAALSTRYATANRAGKKLLPRDIQNNPTVYPAADVMKRGIFQTDLSEETLALYEKYWEKLKIGM